MYASKSGSEQRRRKSFSHLLQKRDMRYYRMMHSPVFNISNVVFETGFFNDAA